MTDSHHPPVGIDALALACPKAFIAMDTLAEARGVPSAKYTQGLGQEKMAIASPVEDTVTLATAAARRALETFDVDPQSIGTLIVGTETGVDHSKPVAVYVHELLGLPERCRTFETKHACYGASAGLTTSLDWIASGRARGQKALVIAADIASYGLNTPGEPTQGAGAVAMVIGEHPRLLRIHPNTIGDYTRQVMDFWRPLYSKYALADGHYSIECYLEALAGARAAALDGGDEVFDELLACLYHVPFVKMAHKAHRKELECVHHRPFDLDTADDQARFDASYQRLVAPWLSLNAQVGNIYTGSLYLALMDLIRQSQASWADRRVSLFSYGSGCGATYMLGQIAPSAHQWAGHCDPQADLDQRRRLSVGEYEAMIAAFERAERAEQLDPSDWGVLEGLAYVGTQDHQRQYRWLGRDGLTPAV